MKKELSIYPSDRLSEIQSEFSKHYPYLKLVFFEYDPSEKPHFGKRTMIINVHQRVDETGHIHRSGVITIDGKQKVKTLEKKFHDLLGLNVQVFRKSGKNWLETTATDEWTLSEQNEKGKEMNQPAATNVAHDYDEYHEQL